MPESANNTAELIVMILVVILGRAVFVNTHQLYKKNSALPLFNFHNFITLMVGLGAWLVLLGALAKYDFFDNFSAAPPHILLAFLPPLIFALFLAFSKKVSDFLKYVPAHWLV